MALICQILKKHFYICRFLQKDPALVCVLYSILCDVANVVIIHKLI
jgi:hypothetical protein